MDPLQAAVLALVQAFTEFLPISSSAHLVLVRWLAGWDDPGLFFDVALHFGTFAGARSVLRPQLDAHLGIGRWTADPRARSWRP